MLRSVCGFIRKEDLAQFDNDRMLVADRTKLWRHVDELIELADLDGDGRLSLVDFVNLCMAIKRL